MKVTTNKFFTLFLFFVFCCGLNAQNFPSIETNSFILPEIILHLKPSPTREDYEVVLQTWTRKTTDIFKKEVWHNIIFKDKKNNIEKKFQDLPQIERDLIIFSTSENYSQFLSFLSNAWEEELKKFDNQDYQPVPKDKIENEKQNPASKSEVLAYQNILFEIRKNFAFEQEKFVEEFFNKNSDIFEKNEKKQTLEIIRAWNEKENLYSKNYEEIFLLKN